jgi:hypothetical protein
LPVRLSTIVSVSDATARNLSVRGRAGGVSGTAGAVFHQGPAR